MAAAVALASMTTTALFAQATVDRDPPGWDRYRVVIDRNVFDKNRRVVAPRTQSTGPRTPSVARDTGPVAPPPPHDPGDDFVLAGVAQDGDQYIAFLENVQTGATARYHVGDLVASRAIAAISLDDVRLATDDKTATEKAVVIVVGRTLTGATPNRPVAAEPRRTTSRSTRRPSADSNADPAAPGAPGAPGAQPGEGEGEGEGDAAATADAATDAPKDGAAPAAKTAPTPTGSDPASILERLRQRRQKELNR